MHHAVDLLGLFQGQGVYVVVLQLPAQLLLHLIEDLESGGCFAHSRHARDIKDLAVDAIHYSILQELENPLLFELPALRLRRDIVRLQHLFIPLLLFLLDLRIG